MVKIMENPLLKQMDDLGGNTPYFWFNTHIGSRLYTPPMMLSCHHQDDYLYILGSGKMQPLQPTHLPLLSWVGGG